MKININNQEVSIKTCDPSKSKLSKKPFVPQFNTKNLKDGGGTTTGRYTMPNESPRKL